MFLQTLKLTSFRNIQNLNLDLMPGLYFFIGENAQGKTNLLESVHFLTTLKSFRTTKDEELINNSSDFTKISADIFDGENTFNVKSIIVKSTGQKSALLNEKKCPKLSEFIGTVKTVFLSHDDYYIIKGSPSYRRRYLDLLICQISPGYAKILIDYRNILKNRNTLLSCINIDYFQLKVWDIKLAEIGTMIINKRAETCIKLDDFLAKWHKELNGDNKEISLKYENPLISKEKNDTTVSNFLQLLENNQDREVRIKQTITGPHRDDIAFFLDGMDIRSFGSSGQVQSLYTALGLSLGDIITNETGKEPVWLLDDIAAFLDAQTLDKLMDILKHKKQVFITVTDAFDYKKYKLFTQKVFTVKNGEIL